MTNAKDAQAPRRRSRFSLWLVRAVLLAWVVVGLLGIAVGFVALLIYEHALQPGVAGPPVTFIVPEGVPAQKVGELLADAGLIDHEFFFRIALKYDGANTPIRHGVYELPHGLSALQLLHALYEGPLRPIDVDRFRVTIPEGLSLAQTAALFEDPDAFLEAARDPDLIAELGLKVESLEGFLMPNTYFFDREPTARDLVERMFRQFQAEYVRLARDVPAVNPLTVVTVASLVEEEAKIDEERPLIAAVIYNRIDAGMPLQIDATLQYALGKYGQRLLEADKQADSPYNTYRYAGLPPGPIANPGGASLRAALQPANVSYRYFVSNADGRTHTFSSTLDEHNRAVARFRRDISVQRRALEAER
ncbi:MAG TPA: endolytic transglycosylase MltG [Candidatus Hydrogenedentes bacterium]|nr:endolytic transglycosylase MltG [Candidatus Hydrogenedentota bacterium]